MTKTFIKALGAVLVAAGLTFAGVVAPAQAANALTPTVTATGTIGTSGTNAYPLTITYTTVGSTATQTQIMLPSGWTFVTQPLNTCSWLTISGITPQSCMGVNNGGIVLFNGSAIPATTTITVTLPANTFNVGTGRSFFVMTATAGNVTVDQGSGTLGGGVSSTVTFDANGGTGTTAAQTASSATALTVNAFTRSGYTFAGWNTAANGTGTAYADGASYAFSSSTTLYAQWTAVLANTGFNGMPYLATGAVLALAGAVIILFARRRQDS